MNTSWNGIKHNFDVKIIEYTIEREDKIYDIDIQVEQHHFNVKKTHEYYNEE